MTQYFATATSAVATISEFLIEDQGEVALSEPLGAEIADEGITMRILEVALRDDIALESSSGLNSATVGQRPDEVFTTGDGRRRVGQADLGVADETVEVHGASSGLQGRTKRILSGVGDGQTGVKSSLVRDEREEDVGPAGVDGQQVAVHSSIHEPRDGSSGRRGGDGAQRSKVAIDGRGAEARQVVAGVGDPGEHNARDRTLESGGIGVDDLPDSLASPTDDGHLCETAETEH